MIIGSRVSKVKKESITALNGARRESMGLNTISIPIRVVTSSKLLNLSVPRFPLLQNGDFSLVPTGKVAMETKSSYL